MAKTDKPNILVIWGDDIGISNLSCYSHGLMLERWPMLMPQRGRSTLSLGRSPGLRRLFIIACCSELLRRSVNSTAGPSSCVRV